MTRAKQFIVSMKSYEDKIDSTRAARQVLKESRPATNVGCFDFGINDQGEPTIQHRQVSGAPTSFEPRVLQDWLDHWFGNYKGA